MSKRTKKTFLPPPAETELPPPEKKLYLGYSTHSTGGEPESDEQWSSRSPQYINVTFNTLTRESGTFFGHDITVSDEVYNADEVFLVIVRYQTGDTFGTSYGNWTVWAAVTSADEAEKISDDITSGALEKAREKDPSKYVYLPWVGYFESLEGVEIHSFRVGNIPASSKVAHFRH